MDHNILTSTYSKTINLSLQQYVDSNCVLYLIFNINQKPEQFS